MAKETSIDLKVNSNIKDLNKDIKQTTKEVEGLEDATKDAGKSFETYGKRSRKRLKESQKEVSKLTQSIGKVEKVGETAEQSLSVVADGMTLIGVESEAVEGVLGKVDDAMKLVSGIESLSKAGEGFSKFGKIGKKAFTSIRGALIASGIGVLIVGIGVAIGAIVKYWDELVDIFTGDATGAIPTILRTVFFPITLTIKAIEVLIEGVKMLWSFFTTGSTDAYYAEKRRQEQLDDTIEQNEKIIEQKKRELEENKKMMKAEEVLAKKRKTASDLYLNALQRELDLKEAQNGTTSETIKLTEELAKKRADDAKTEFDDAKKQHENQAESAKLATESYQASINLLKATIEKHGEESEQAKKAREEKDKLGEVYVEEINLLNKSQQAYKDTYTEREDAINDEKITNVQANKDRTDLYKEYRDKRISFERELFDAKMESIKDGYEKERTILLEDFRRQREDIMNNEDLTSKQKKALTEENKRIQDKAIENLELEHQEMLLSIDSKTQDIRISQIKDEFERANQEINKGYKDRLKEIEANEKMTEDQKTEVRLLAKEDRDRKLEALDLKSRQAQIQAQIDLAKAKEIQNEKDFEVSMEFRKQQLDLERELELSNEELTAEQKLLIEAEYQKNKQALDDETAEHKKGLEDDELADLNEKLALAQKGLKLISDLTEFANEQQTKSIEKKYAKEIAGAEGNEEQIREIEKRKIEDLNKVNKRAFQIKKSADLASATIDGFRAVLSAYAQAPVGFKIPASILAGAFSALQIGKIASTKFEGATFDESISGAGGGAGEGAGDIISPEFNVVGDSGINDLQGANQQPLEAYVVSGNVTSAQSLDRNRIQNATI